MTVEIKTERIITIGMAIVILVMGVLLFYGNGCNPTSPATATKITETNKSDTSTRSTGPQQAPIVYPAPVSSDKTIYVPQPYQPATNVDALVKQNYELMDKYNEVMVKLKTINRYNDTLLLTDSSGKQVGSFQYNDLVTDNEIKQRQPKYSINQQVVTNTKTTTIDHPYIPKNQVFGGLEIGGNQAYPINDIEVGLMFKNKKDRVVKAAYVHDFHGLGEGGKIGTILNFKKQKRWLYQK